MTNHPDHIWPVRGANGEGQPPGVGRHPTAAQLDGLRGRLRGLPGKTLKERDLEEAARRRRQAGLPLRRGDVRAEARKIGKERKNKQKAARERRKQTLEEN